ncbi:hypothetical protein SAMN05216266_114166 [Amycolatopsis marina]|uniref:Uncharacterized protein n=1 Tax=Amycolatopsis marina TaxID=490629 RepID=A0A1I1BP99_9PSEU|nr:DUF6153 family protein [Amycolatopsis marina]SFB50280.1 hypothetical protein SAMN05216266_114166 [Amycolatopsis marina]
MAALILAGHLLGTHSHADVPSVAADQGHHLSTTAPPEHHPGLGVGESEGSQPHDSAGDGHCGYLCVRNMPGLPAATAAWTGTPAPAGQPLPTAAADAVDGARAPPDPVRELQVMRV